MNPLINSADASRFSTSENCNGLFDLEQQGHFLVERIGFLENQLQETRIKMQAATFSKMELEKILEKERNELENTKAQLKAFQGTLQHWEQERFNENESSSSVLKSLQLDILQKENKSLNEQLNKLQSKNVELSLQIEEMQKQLRSQKDFENLLHSSKKAFETTVEKVYSESQKLEKDLNCLKKQVTLSKHAGEQMIILLKHHHEALNTVYEEHECLKKSTLTQAGELRLEKNLQKAAHKDGTVSGIEVESLRKQLQQKENIILDLNRELGLEIEEKKKLNEMLDNMLNDQIKSNQMEQYFRTCISNLEKHLEEKNQTEDADADRFR